MASLVMSLSEAFGAVRDMKGVGDTVRNQSGELRSQLNELAEFRAFGAETATAISSLVQTQFRPLLMAVENAYWKQGVKAREMVDTFMEVMGETENNAVFDHDALVDLGSEMDLRYEDLMTLNEELESIYLNVEDIMTLSMPSSTAFERDYARAQSSLNTTRERLGDFTFSFSDIEELMHELEYYVQKLDDNRGLDPTSNARRELLNGGRFDFVAFAENMSGLHNEFLAAEAAALEELIRSWEGQDIETILRSLSNPMTQAEQLAFMGLLGSMSDDAFNTFSSLVGYVIRPEYLSEVGLKWFLEFGIANVGNLRRSIYEGLRSQVGVTRAHNEAVRKVDNLRGIGKALKKALPWISFGVGTAMGIWNGNRIGEAVSYGGAALGVGLGAGAIGKGIAAFLLGSNPVGWALVGTVAIGTGMVILAGWGFSWLYKETVVGDVVKFSGDVIDAVVGSTVARFNNVVNFASDLWNVGTNLVDNVGQAIGGALESLNPFNWSWGN